MSDTRIFKKRHLTVVLGLAVGIGLSWLILRSTDWHTIVATARDVDRFYIAVSLLLGLAVWTCRAIRFQLLVETTHRTSLWPFFASVTISEFVDIALPFRIGIPVRAYIINRMAGVTYMHGAAASILDRLMDAFAVLLMLGTTAFFILPAGNDLVFPGEMLMRQEPVVVPRMVIVTAVGFAGAVVVGATVFLTLVYLFRDYHGNALRGLLGRASLSLATKVSEAAVRFSQHLNAFTSIRQVIALLTVNLLIWTLTCISVITVFLAFGVRVPILAPIVILSTIMLSTLTLPNPPGFVGLYHMAIVVGTSIVAPDTPLPLASAIAIHMHLLHMGMSAALGCGCMAVAHLTIRELRDAQHLEVGGAVEPEADQP